MRRLITAAVAATTALSGAAPTLAQERGTAAPPPGVGQAAAPPLSMEEAIALSRGGQPRVFAFEREAVASEQAAVAARSLPDPVLSVGIQNFPILRGDNAFDPIADFMTMYTIGIMREQVRRSRREAEAARLRAEAVVSRFQGSAQQREIQRDVMIAWINAVEARAKQTLLDRLISDLRVGQKVMEAGIPVGSSTPALALQMQAEIAVAEGEQADARGQEARARAELARWIGPAAFRPLPDSVPAPALPPAAREAVNIAVHPQVQAAQAEAVAAERQVDARRRERRPNISWSVMLGVRPKYGEMLSGTVSIPLQTNRRNRQDRLIAEAQARADAARLRAEDMRRELGGRYDAALGDYQSAEGQLSALLDRAIPSLESSFEAAEARYAAGQGTLELPLTIVRRYVETTIQTVEQRGRRARAAAELIYLTQDAPR